MKKPAIITLAMAAVLTLSGCNVFGSGHAGTSVDPVPSSDRYVTTSYELEDGFGVTCLSGGSGKSAVLSCLPARKGAELVPIGSSRYSVRYMELEDGRIVPCLHAGSGKRSVVSCVEQPR